jgi:hypothetical protein
MNDLNDLPAPGPVRPPGVVAEPDAELAECLVLTAPAWFARDDFLDWRQGQAEGQWCGPACWLPQDRTGAYTDVFVTFDRGRPLEPGVAEPGLERFWEGSDADTLPDDIYLAIGQLLHEYGLRRGVLRIKPA